MIQAEDRPGLSGVGSWNGIFFGFYTFYIGSKRSFIIELLGFYWRFVNAEVFLFRIRLLCWLSISLSVCLRGVSPQSRDTDSLDTDSCWDVFYMVLR